MGRASSLGGERAFASGAAARRARDAWAAKKLAPIGLHECRHTYAAFMIAAGVNAKALSTDMDTPRSPSPSTATATSSRNRSERRRGCSRPTSTGRPAESVRRLRPRQARRDRRPNDQGGSPHTARAAGTGGG